MGACRSNSKYITPPSKRLKPTETYFFSLFPQDILTDIDILTSGLEHHDKLKAAITRIILCVTPFSLTFPKNFRRPTTISVYTLVDITSVLIHGNIGAFKLTCVCASKRYSLVVLQLLKL